MSIGNKVRNFRQRAGLSQADLAERIGLTQSAVSKIERDRRAMTLEVAAKIAKACQVADDDWAALRTVAA